MSMTADPMKPLTLSNYAQDRWVVGSSLVEVPSALDGRIVALTGSKGLDFGAMVRHARTVGGPALRAMTFHQRARIIKSLAEAILARKEELYELSFQTGATRRDSGIDIEGGTGTLHSYASKGRRELPNARLLLDGDTEPLSKAGGFVGQHVYTSLQGVALHINAFNFPVWGMLEKLAPTLLAGVPAIVKPATATAYLTEATFRIMIEAGVLPAGALQLIVGSTGDILDHLTCQDVVSFTGSAATAEMLQAHPVIAREGVRFVAERDSLNASVLGPDAAPGTPEFDLFIKEVVREMTVKAGQKCTAIRRAFVPAASIDAAEEALKAALGKVVVGDPRQEGVTMGALASLSQRQDVAAKVAALQSKARIVFGQADGGDAGGAYFAPVLLRADNPWSADVVHDTEPFGPVSTLMPYKDLEDAARLVNRGQGSLVMSLFTHDPAIAAEMVMQAGAFHGRMVIIDRDSARESTGHGSPLPVLVHGGPGRAGGGEELGGMRGVLHYMQRTALQGSPRLLSGVADTWLKGAPKDEGAVHPFRVRFGELPLGYSVSTRARTVTVEDIDRFAAFTGDTVHAHLDEQAAATNPSIPGRTAHGALLLSFAAGLLVDPAPGPAPATSGLDTVRFLKPVSPGDSVRVELTAKSKSQSSGEFGEVRWDAVILNQDGEPVATYDLLTMNAL
jgi:oxepin-CoA hydrolase/3-oxo-5,6-dehydrosuberyl-CoA semialdehyde dehydrogenase